MTGLLFTAPTTRLGNGPDREPCAGNDCKAECEKKMENCKDLCYGAEGEWGGEKGNERELQKCYGECEAANKSCQEKC